MILSNVRQWKKTVEIIFYAFCVAGHFDAHREATQWMLPVQGSSEFTLGSQSRITRDSNETFFLPAPQSAPSIGCCYEPAVNDCHLCKSAPNTGSQVRVRKVNSEPMQNQSLVSTLTNIANSTNKQYNAEMWVHQLTPNGVKQLSC